MNWKIVLAALAAFLTFACGKEDNSGQQTVTLASDPAQLTFESAGGSQELKITSGIKPTVSTSDAWITLTEGGYASNILTVNVKVAEHSGTTPRTGSIRVIGDKQSLMVSVTQNIAEVPMTADKTSAAFDRFGGETVITVTSSSQPEVTTDASWCLAIAGTIDANRQTAITIAAPANRKASAQSGTVTVKCGSQSVKIAVSLEAYQTPATASTTALTPEMVYEAMAPAWNMGNHMDAISNGVANETVWGNAKATQSTMNGVKAAGFKFIRLPVTWQGHIGDAPAYRLEEKWLARVEEIVGYAEKAGLGVILNTHHDESYWLDIAKATESTKDELFSVWVQLAQRFQDKGEWLVFEPYNEIQDGGWGWSDAFKANSQKQYDILNSWAQVFVDAVRSTGGNNATRWLGINGYAASPIFTLPNFDHGSFVTSGLVIPQDYTSANRIMVGVHDYDPYNYTIATPLVEQWGHTADPGKSTSDKEESLVWLFDQLKATYLDNNIPVYIGEMGCSRHKAEDMPYQYYYMEYFCKAAADRLLPMFLWDNGASGSGSEKHGYIDHGTGQMVDDIAQKLIDLMVKAATTKDPAYTLESVYNSAP